MKKSTRILLGLTAGAVTGALPALVYVFKFRPCRDNFNSFDAIMGIIFRSFHDHHYMLLIVGLGAITGAALGGSLGVAKWCFAMTAIFICGIILGTAVLFYPMEKMTEQGQAIWGQMVADERAVAYLQGLRAIERGKTNELYLMRFQDVSRMVLTNYLCDTEKQMRYYNERKPYGNVDFLFTNSPTYRIIQKYVKQHL